MLAAPDFTAFAWIASHPWLYPALEVVHIIGIALLLGSLVLVELRIWGLGAALPLQPLARLGLTLTLTGFAIAASSGLILFASQAADLLGNRAFIAKMLLLLTAGLNALTFHWRGGLAKADGWARAQSVVSLALWLAIIGCGRWIAYY